MRSSDHPIGNADFQGGEISDVSNIGNPKKDPKGSDKYEFVLSIHCL